MTEFDPHLDPYEEQNDEPVVEESSALEPITEEAVLLTYVFANHGLFTKAAPILKPEYFTGKHMDALKFAQSQYQSSHQVPNRLMISATSGFLPELVTDHEDPVVVDWVEKSIESFCRQKAGDQFLLRAVDRLGRDRSNAAMADLRAEMEKVAQISMARDLGTEFHEDYRAMLVRAKENSSISTGSAFMDKVLSGGLTRPSMSIYSAATGDGKSIFLANRAIDYIRQFPQEDVVYYTLENSEELTYQRLAAMMAEIDINTVLDRVDDVESYILKNGKKEGRLFIKRFPFKGTTMADIRAHYYDLRSHRKANLRAGFLDYMELMSPTVDVKIENLHVRDEQVSNEVYDFVHREKLIWWTAAQQTKGAEEEVEAKKGKVSGGVKKVFACDNLFIGKRTDDDTLQEKIWLICKKARSSIGYNAAIPINWNAKTQRMTDWPDELEFQRANPRIFGLGKTKFETDPVAHEMGIRPPEKPPIPDNERAAGIRNQLINRLRNPLRTDS